MTNEEFIILAEKVAEGSASISEIALYHASYESFQQDPQSLTADGLNSNELKKESLTRFWKSHDDSGRVVKLWPRIAVASRRKVGISLIAAAAAAAITLGTWMYINMSPDVKSGDVAQNDIAPGRNGATITLGIGKVIQLSDAKSGVVVGNGKIAYSSPDNIGTLHDEIASIPRNDGVGENSMILNASTARGQTYQFTLPDGTHVWLNADSKLEFPSNFINSKTRNVKLTGEGYFEVAKDKAHPFVVKTSDQNVEVLGTHFNLNTYGDEHRGTVTSLLEGSVRVTGENGARVLKPGDRGVNTIKGVMLLMGDAGDDVDWKNGDFVFQQEPLSEIMKKVSRWYDVDVIYADDVDTKQTFGGKVSRKRNISQVIRALQATQALKFKIEGKKVYVSN